MTSATPSASSVRLASLDQFRGFTVAAMLLVNFAGEFRVTPALLRHHNTYCSFADTVMPQFFFAVGFALRLVMLRERERVGMWAATSRGVWRGVSLVILGLIFYQLDGGARTWAELEALGVGGFFASAFQRSPLQALTHIGLTTLWVLPVVAGSWRVRLVFGVASVAAHLALSHSFWFDTLHRWRVIDGGVLGFLTWSVPTLAGSLAYDWVRGGAHPLWRLLNCGGVLMGVGYGLACLSQGGVLAAPPFWPPAHDVDMWTMSQRAASGSYLVFAAGFAMVVYAGFVWWCDGRGGKWRVFEGLGKNALVAYLLHMTVLAAMAKYAPSDAPGWYAAVFTGVGMWVSVRMTGWCTERGLVLRL